MRTTKQRGYGSEHKRERARWQRVIDTTGANCARCGGLIAPGQPWDLGHTDDRTGWTGPEHAHCNRADGARKTNAIRRRASADAKAPRPSREW